MNTPSLTLDLASVSVLDYADLVPRLLAPGGNWITGPVKWTEKAVGRKLDVRVVPFPIERAKIELELEAEKFSDVMARSPAVATRIKAILDQADACEDPILIASMIREVRNVGGNIFLWAR